MLITMIGMALPLRNMFYAANQADRQGAFEAITTSIDLDKAMHHAERAFELARDSRSPRDEQIVEDAQRALALLHDVQDNMSACPFPIGDDEDNLYDDDSDGEEESFSSTTEKKSLPTLSSLFIKAMRGTLYLSA